MRVRTGAVCLVCGAIGFVLFSLSQPQLTGQEKGKDPGFAKWEYKIGTASMESLTQSGNDGWELVAIDRGIPYFKRPKH
jgi:hypothetical protein